LGIWRMMEPGKPRINWAIWDDVAYTAPRKTGIHPLIVELRGELTAARPEMGVLCMTAANRNDIAAPLRNLPKFEIIVPMRGYFEVQAAVSFKNFYDPEKDLSNLQYLEEGPFVPLPGHIQARYDKWRVDQKQYVRSKQYIKDVRQFIRDRNIEEEGKIEEAKPKPETPSPPKGAQFRAARRPTPEELPCDFFISEVKKFGIKADQLQLHRLWQYLIKERGSLDVYGNLEQDLLEKVMKEVVE